GERGEDRPPLRPQCSSPRSGETLSPLISFPPPEPGLFRRAGLRLLWCGRPWLLRRRLRRNGRRPLVLRLKVGEGLVEQCLAVMEPRGLESLEHPLERGVPPDEPLGIRPLPF